MARVTVSDVAALAGVSITTASRVLNPNAKQGIRISDATRQRVRDAAKKLRYVSSAHARILRQQTSPMVGLLMHHVSGFMDQTLLEQLSIHLGEIGKELVLGIHLDRPELMERCVRTFASYRTAAVLVLSSSGILPDELANSLIAARESCGPTICFAGRERRPQFAYLRVDFLSMCRRALILAANCGYRRVLQVAANNAAGHWHRDFLQRAAEEFEQVEVDSVLGECPAQTIGAQALEPIRKRVKDGPLLVLTDNDWVAFSVMRNVLEAGMRIPEDVAIIGTGNHAIAEHAKPGLTSFDIRGVTPFLAGKSAELIAALDRKEPFEAGVYPVTPSLMVRDSFVPANVPAGLSDSVALA